MRKQCKHCKKIFIQPHFNSKYCSLSCKMKFYGKRYQKRIFDYNKKYYKSNTDKYKKLWTEYYQANKDKLNARSRERYYFLKESKPDLLRKWNKNGRKKYRKTSNGSLVHRLDSQRRRSLGTINKKEWLEKLESFGGKCVNCGSSEKITIDHIIPVSKGGTNDTNNLQPLCSHCNSSKGTKIKDEEKVRHSK